MIRQQRQEQAIQRAVFQHFAARAMPGVFAFHVPNGGARSAIEAAVLKGLGVAAGVSDIMAIRAGMTFALELNAEGGRLSAAQRDTQQLSGPPAPRSRRGRLDQALAQLGGVGRPAGNVRTGATA